MTSMDHAALDDAARDGSGYPLEPDFPKGEYDLRIGRAREYMAGHELDALVITSSAVGQWFTSHDEPHAWHDQVQARSAWYILTHNGDYLYSTPTNNTHFSALRRSVW